MENQYHWLHVLSETYYVPEYPPLEVVGGTHHPAPYCLPITWYWTACQSGNVAVLLGSACWNKLQLLMLDLRCRPEAKRAESCCFHLCASVLSLESQTNRQGPKNIYEVNRCIKHLTKQVAQSLEFQVHLATWHLMTLFFIPSGSWKHFYLSHSLFKNFIDV